MNPVKKLTFYSGLSKGMKLIVGLGNPGQDYQATRHNVGFVLADQIAKTVGIDFEFDKKINAEIGRGKWQGKPVILAKPQTFVNKSGEAVKKISQKSKVKSQNLVVAHDDLDIEFGNFKLSFGKNSGGHRGVESIIKALKTNKFWRLRVGTANKRLAVIRRLQKKVPTRKTSRGSSISQSEIGTKKETVGDFVLSKFSPSEQTALRKIIKKAIERLEQVI